MTDSTEAFTLENLKALELAIVEGVKEVKYTDKVVVYRDLDEMFRIRDLMRKCLGLTSNSTKRLFGRYNKGIC